MKTAQFKVWTEYYLTRVWKWQVTSKQDHIPCYERVYTRQGSTFFNLFYLPLKYLSLPQSRASVNNWALKPFAVTHVWSLSWGRSSHVQMWKPRDKDHANGNQNSKPLSLWLCIHQLPARKPQDHLQNLFNIISLYISSLYLFSFFSLPLLKKLSKITTSILITLYCAWALLPILCTVWVSLRSTGTHVFISCNMWTQLHLSTISLFQILCFPALQEHMHKVNITLSTAEIASTPFYLFITCYM